MTTRGWAKHPHRAAPRDVEITSSGRGIEAWNSDTHSVHFTLAPTDADYPRDKFYVSMTPDEADALAHKLLDLALAARTYNSRFLPKPPTTEQ